MTKALYLIGSIIIIAFYSSCRENSAINYKNDIAPLLTTCSSNYCHGGGSEISFTDYTSTLNSIETGRVIGALKQEERYKAMPFGNEVEGKWSEENIQLLEDWITLGMPEF